MNLTAEDRELLPLLAKVILQEVSALESFKQTIAPKAYPDIRLQRRVSPSDAFGISYKVSTPPPSKKRETSKADIVASCQLEECRDEAEVPNKVDFKKIGLEPLLEALYDSLSNLTPREVEILKRRYCFSNREDWTFDALGAEYGISRQRVKQIEQNALKKLRKALGDKFSKN